MADRSSKASVRNADSTAPSTSSLRPSRMRIAEDNSTCDSDGATATTKSSPQLCKINGRLLSCPLLVLLSTASWMVAVHCAKRTYVRGVNETSPYTNETPFLLTYMTNLGFTALYPCYVLTQCHEKEKFFTKIAFKR